MLPENVQTDFTFPNKNPTIYFSQVLKEASERYAAKKSIVGYIFEGERSRISSRATLAFHFVGQRVVTTFCMSNDQSGLFYYVVVVVVYYKCTDAEASKNHITKHTCFDFIS